VVSGSRPELEPLNSLPLFFSVQGYGSTAFVPTQRGWCHPLGRVRVRPHGNQEQSERESVIIVSRTSKSRPARPRFSLSSHRKVVEEVAREFPVHLLESTRSMLLSGRASELVSLHLLSMALLGERHIPCSRLMRSTCQLQYDHPSASKSDHDHMASP
jgi:hypothetical protein